MRGKARPRYVTVAIIPHGVEAARVVCLPWAWWRALVLTAGALVAGLLWFSSAYLDSLERLSRLAQLLRLQARAYRELELAFVGDQGRLEQLMAAARSLDDRLRQLAAESAELRRMLSQADAAPPPRPPTLAGPRPAALSAGAGGPIHRAEVLRAVRQTLVYAEEALQLEGEHLRQLRVSTLEFLRRRAHTPTIWPTEGWVSSSFGSRRHPVTGRPDFHYGIDIAGIPGTPVLAAADGTVILAGRQGNYGLLVVVDHGYGLRTLYAHLSRIVVRPGQRVVKGQRIGALGSTGLSTGPHLHYEVHVRGRPVNPRRFLP